jgi:hypothetical protein
MSLNWPAPKDPDEIKDYVVDWSDLLGEDTIAASIWIIPDGLTKTSDSNTGATATIWLSSGVAGTSYALVNRITTAGGRTYDRTIKLKVKSL